MTASSKLEVHTKLTEADVRVVLTETGRTVEKRGRKTTLKNFDVVAPDGAVIGAVCLEMATFERRTRGRMYVNSRWHSPRWFYYVGGKWKGRRSADYTTKKQAIADLLAAALSEEQRQP